MSISLLFLSIFNLLVFPASSLFFLSFQTFVHLLLSSHLFSFKFHSSFSSSHPHTPVYIILFIFSLPSSFINSIFIFIFIVLFSSYLLFAFIPFSLSFVFIAIAFFHLFLLSFFFTSVLFHTLLSLSFFFI